MEHSNNSPCVICKTVMRTVYARIQGVLVPSSAKYVRVELEIEAVATAQDPKVMLYTYTRCLFAFTPAPLSALYSPLLEVPGI